MITKKYNNGTAYKYISNAEMKSIIEQVIIFHFDKTENQILFRTRLREISDIRHVYRYFIRLKTSYILKEIADITGAKTHCTVINSIKRVNEFIDTDKRFASEMIAILNIIDNQINERTKTKPNENN